MSQYIVKILEEYRSVQHLAVTIVIRLLHYSEEVMFQGRGPELESQGRW